ncbi:MAG: amidase [Phycisphaerales bacterium]|nr:amidase [Phycisphaerales bacterium]
MLNDPTLPIQRRGFLAMLSAAAVGSIPGEQAAAAVVEPLEDGDSSVATSSITAKTIEEAEKLAGVTFTNSERMMMARSIGDQVAMFKRRLEHSTLTNQVFPATTFNPVIENHPPRQVTVAGPLSNLRVGRTALPEADVDIAFASLVDLSHWIHTKQISCQRLTQIYVDRLKQYGPILNCTVTLMEQSAIAQAKKLDQELARGRSRGILHGIPWGAKDLFDTKGVKTTFGAEVFKNRIPEADAEVVKRLRAAGAVLVGKLSLGALAYGDVWFGGQTKSPWNTGVGSSGSSAGSASATAAGLVAFSLGTETCGSIISPCRQCGAFGLRPTFGRVPRDGAMSLCWSLDKAGPICRHTDDLAIVLDVINGASPLDPDSVTRPLHPGIGMGGNGLTVGIDPKWFDQHEDEDLSVVVHRAIKASGATIKHISMPDLPWESLFGILTAEATASFETLTREDTDDHLAWQEPEAWPNTFRQSWFIPAPEYIQLQRFRRQVMELYARLFDTVDLMVCPPFRGGTLIATNCTGHPAIACPIGMGVDNLPRNVALIGQLFDEGTLLRMSRELEARTWGGQRPPVGS